MLSTPNIFSLLSTISGSIFLIKTLRSPHKRKVCQHHDFFLTDPYISQLVEDPVIIS